MTTALSARRPSAGAVPGRWGACLAVRAPPAAFIRSRRTVWQTALFLVAPGPQQLSCLGAEVPDGLLEFMARANTPMGVDLPVRLLIAPAGFRLVVLPFLRGQVFLGGEPGVSQGEHDPLRGVARASLLQPAGFLQGLDAGLPVAR